MRYRYGHGSLLRDGKLAVPHVGYLATEHWNGSLRATSGHIRGDARALEALSTARQLSLLTQDGIELPIILIRRHTDRLNWEFTTAALLDDYAA